jgi:pyruvate/2-oxoglutarate/acetoin dehydrogenase E1 component
MRPATVSLRAGVGKHRLTELEAGTQLDGINRAIRSWMRENERVILIGEDIRSPYGGAFKVTRALSDEFPDRVLNAPISEAGIVGIGNGLALGGARPIVEIMFGDFLTLCCDQLLNHAAKFRGMYAGKARAPLILRTPMGGGRGYGPTHSQNLEKHFVGVPGLAVVVLHGRTRVGAMYEALRDVEDPVLVIENKLLYKERPGAALPAGYSLFETNGPLPGTVLSPPGEPDITVVAFGRMSMLAERVAAAILEAEEVAAELIFPLLVSPLDVDAIRESVARTGRLLVVEEGAASFDLGSEVIAAVATTYTGQRPLRVRRLAAHPAPIPSSVALERAVLPTEEALSAACLELFDA